MMRGERVLLRGIEREDLPRLWEIWNDLETQDLATRRPAVPVSLAEMEAEFDKRARESDRRDVEFGIEVERKVIGRCGLFAFGEMSRACSLGISIDREYWGQGYGREAVRLLLEYGFRIRNVRKVCLETLASNERAVASFVACGFVEEGRLREQEWYDGAYRDSLFMGILREEWDRDRAPGS